MKQIVTLKAKELAAIGIDTCGWDNYCAYLVGGGRIIEGSDSIHEIIDWAENLGARQAQCLDDVEVPHQNVSYPLLRRTLYTGVVVCFTSLSEGILVDLGREPSLFPERKVGELGKYIRHDNEEVWEDL